MSGGDCKREGENLIPDIDYFALLASGSGEQIDREYDDNLGFALSDETGSEEDLIPRPPPLPRHENLLELFDTTSSTELINENILRDFVAEHPSPVNPREDHSSATSYSSSTSSEEHDAVGFQQRLDATVPMSIQDRSIIDDEQISESEPNTSGAQDVRDANQSNQAIDGSQRNLDGDGGKNNIADGNHRDHTSSTTESSMSKENDAMGLVNITDTVPSTNKTNIGIHENISQKNDTESEAIASTFDDATLFSQPDLKDNAQQLGASNDLVRVDTAIRENDIEINSVTFNIQLANHNSDGNINIAHQIEKPFTDNEYNSSPTLEDKKIRTPDTSGGDSDEIPARLIMCELSGSSDETYSIPDHIDLADLDVSGSTDSSSISPGSSPTSIANEVAEDILEQIAHSYNINTHNNHGSNRVLASTSKDNDRSPEIKDETENSNRKQNSVETENLATFPSIYDVADEQETDKDNESKLPASSNNVFQWYIPGFTCKPRLQSSSDITEQSALVPNSPQLARNKKDEKPDAAKKRDTCNTPASTTSSSNTGNRRHLSSKVFSQLSGLTQSVLKQTWEENERMTSEEKDIKEDKDTSEENDREASQDRDRKIAQKIEVPKKEVASFKAVQASSGNASCLPVETTNRLKLCERWARDNMNFNNGTSNIPSTGRSTSVTHRDLDINLQASSHNSNLQGLLGNQYGSTNRTPTSFISRHPAPVASQVNRMRFAEENNNTLNFPTNHNRPPNKVYRRGMTRASTMTFPFEPTNPHPIAPLALLRRHPIYRFFYRDDPISTIGAEMHLINSRREVDNPAVSPSRDTDNEETSNIDTSSCSEVHTEIDTSAKDDNSSDNDSVTSPYGSTGGHFENFTPESVSTDSSDSEEECIQRRRDDHRRRRSDRDMKHERQRYRESTSYRNPTGGNHDNKDTNIGNKNNIGLKKKSSNNNNNNNDMEMNVTTDMSDGDINLDADSNVDGDNVNNAGTNHATTSLYIADGQGDGAIGAHVSHGTEEFASALTHAILAEAVAHVSQGTEEFASALAHAILSEAVVEAAERIEISNCNSKPKSAQLSEDIIDNVLKDIIKGKYAKQTDIGDSSPEE